MSGDSQVIKVSLTIGGASLNIEGDKDTVATQISLFYETFGRSGQSSAGISSGDPDVAGTAPRSTATRSRRSSSGPSCATRIDALRAEGFFAQKRSAKDVADRLDEKATPYGANHIAAAIQQMTKKGVLRRMKGDSGWQYVNP